MNKTALIVSLALIGQVSYAGDLESLLEGKQQESKVVAGQQTRLSSAIESLLGKTNSEQKVFVRQLEAQDWQKALLQFNPAFGGTAFERSENGVALKALLMFKAGLQVSAIEKTFSVASPKKIHPEIIHSLREVASDKSPAWDVAQIKWNNEWIEIFGRSAEVRSQLKNISLKSDLEFLKDLASKTPQNTRERAIVDWQLALSYAINDKADEAAKVLAQLLKNDKSPIGQDLINLTAGRLLFQNGYFDPAIKYYQKVSKDSEYWLESQEEMAWSYLRKAQPQDSIAISKTLMNQAFNGYIGPESYFVDSLGHLKVCDYPNVMTTLTKFPKTFKDRTLSLKELSEKGNNDLISKFLQKARSGKVTWSNLGKDAQSLPRAVTKDQKLENLLFALSVFEKESRSAEQIYASSLAATGFQGEFEELKNKVNTRENNTKNSAIQRVQDLAKAEVVEIKKILDKLHIVEAELVQQIDLASKVEKFAGKTADEKLGTVASNKSSDALVFPAEKEIWFDELSNFKVDVKKGCQAIKR